MEKNTRFIPKREAVEALTKRAAATPDCVREGLRTFENTIERFKIKEGQKP